MITIKNLIDIAKNIYALNSQEYGYIGIRFENKDRNIGNDCECSKHNPDREDERDFPAFDSDEYFWLPEFEGTSAWDLSADIFYHIPKYIDQNEDAHDYYNNEHCYIIAGDYLDYPDYILDDNEIVIKDAIVIHKIY